MSLRFRYLLVYGLMVAGDWLQGPYIYALYSDYGYLKETIAYLFIVGFGSSMIIGTFIGSLADRWGRKRMALCYCGLYIFSCLTKHNKTLSWLFLGRVTGGAATSLLMSVFESWLVKESAICGESETVLSVTLSYATLLNSIVAIISGFAAEQIVQLAPLTSISQDHSDWYFGGYTAPFDLAIACLAIGAYLMMIIWNENYGSAVFIPSCESVRNGLTTVLDDKTILSVGLAQGCFEGAMYCFVFMWTPAIMDKAEGTKPALGTIFSIFMIGCMVGSQLFGYMVQQKIRPEKILLYVFGISAFVLLFRPLDDLLGTDFQFYGFVMFEVCVGVYFPCMGTLKSIVVPEEKRATIYNIYRVPLNAIVLLVLLSNAGVSTTFLFCSFLLVGATLLQTYIFGAMTYQKVESMDDTV